ncbi:cysteine desulfurase [Microbacterium endophyticum]|uniref:Cysteine desulfurase n=1 Tax=Microbacterium endophyticum TaxID=1526412 RepID=A0A7W4V0U9_9MICO|nr:cysteine desulfurase family protein [Microbacterium endophyticum]MBB2974811.1 cysteine desulfurase [Microbacterium endophyticum]NIK37108.1 cysteine desulfurase [Microbacterium endophyticum]
MLYLDNAATTPVRPEVRDAIWPYLAEWFGNPSSHHTVGEAAASALADARARVAKVVGMRTGDIVFTSGGTEANNLAIKGIAVAAASARGASHVVTTAIEHESILQSVDYLQRVHGFTATLLEVDSAGRLEAAALANALSDRTALAAIGYANNEVGTVQDTASLSAIAKAHRIPLHVDAVQAAGWLPLAGLGADSMAIAGHKIGAPPGTGVLAVRGRIPLEPLLHGGGQERDRRSGTENVAGAVGFALALELAEAERIESVHRVGHLRDEFVTRVLQLVPSARLTGSVEHRLANSASFTFEGTSGEAVLLELERRGVVSSSGSACAAGSDEPSHVLLALGVEPATAQTAVRFTFAHTQHDPLAPVADAVAASVAQLSA